MHASTLINDNVNARSKLNSVNEIIISSKNKNINILSNELASSGNNVAINTNEKDNKPQDGSNIKSIAKSNSQVNPNANVKILVNEAQAATTKYDEETTLKTETPTTRTTNVVYTTPEPKTKSTTGTTKGVISNTTPESSSTETTHPSSIPTSTSTAEPTTRTTQEVYITSGPSKQSNSTTLFPGTTIAPCECKDKIDDYEDISDDELRDRFKNSLESFLDFAMDFATNNKMIQIRTGKLSTHP